MKKTVLLTGTSSGLGRAAAKLFQHSGWNVVATMRDPSKESELHLLDNVLVQRLDLEDETSIGSAIDRGIAEFGGIDVLVNNAGFGAFGPLEVTPISTVRRQFEVNLFGVVQTMQAIFPHFRARRAGTIVNVTSIGGRMTFPMGSLYHSSKFAVEGLTEALQYELAPLGIQVKLVEPGGIKTNFSGRSMTMSNEPAIPEYQPLIKSVVDAFSDLLGSGSEPEQIAAVVLSAATDDTGTVRHAAGDDAVTMLAHRANTNDKDFFAGINTMFGVVA